MKEKYILADAGVLISLTSSCLESVLRFLHERTDLTLIIPPSVEREAVRRPIERQVKKYLFSALRIKNHIEDGIIKVVEDRLDEETKRIMDLANNMYYIRGRPLKLIQYGESEMVALARKLDIGYVAIDERTMRLLIENPPALKTHIEEEFRINVMTNKKNYDQLGEMLRGIKVFRSSEFVMLAYELGYFDRFHQLKESAFLSALYKVKYAGCAISFEEIDAYIRGS